MSLLGLLSEVVDMLSLLCTILPVSNLLGSYLGLALIGIGRWKLVIIRFST